MKDKIGRLANELEKVEKILNEIGAKKMVLSGEIKSFGNSGHIIMPKRYLNKRAKVIIE